MLDIIKKAIKEEMEAYALEVEKELTEKYKKEFNENIRSHRRRVILDVCEKIKMEHSINPEHMESIVHIRM